MTQDAKPRVLVVEDQKDLADVYAGWLRDDYHVMTAYGGQEALDEFDESVDVVLLDRRMPGLSGDEVLERIRDRSTSCRVAMVTAINPELDIIDMGFDDYLVKPVIKDELIETVEGLLALTTYDERIREYYSLSAKHTALLTNKSESELKESEEYRELKSQLADVREEFEELRDELDYEQLKNAFNIIDFDAPVAGANSGDES